MADVEAIAADVEQLVERERSKLVVLIQQHGWDRGARIYGCQLLHLPGVACICGAPAGPAAAS